MNGEPRHDWFTAGLLTVALLGMLVAITAGPNRTLGLALMVIGYVWSAWRIIMERRRWRS